MIITLNNNNILIHIHFEFNIQIHINNLVHNEFDILIQTIILNNN